MSKQKTLYDIPPHGAVPWDKTVVYALKALAAGTANDGQQQKALAWIVNIACRVNDPAYYPQSQRDTDFCLGMQHVGHQILTLVNKDLSEDQAP